MFCVGKRAELETISRVGNVSCSSYRLETIAMDSIQIRKQGLALKVSTPLQRCMWGQNSGTHEGSSVFRQMCQGAVGKADFHEEQLPVILRRYGGFSENETHRLIYLGAWSPVGGNAWEGLRVVASLEETCHQGTGLAILKAQANYSQICLIPTCG